MDKPSESEVNEFVKMGENAPKTRELDENGRKAVLDAIANADFGETQVAPTEVRIESGKDSCPHCDEPFEYSVPSDTYTIVCRKCGKSIPICDKCHGDAKCEDCIYCDLANFRNYLIGKVPLPNFLASMNPPLTDMTASSIEGFEPSYDGYVNDEGGDDVEWDVKYWGIYGRITNSMLTMDDSDVTILSFLREIIAENKS